MKQYDVVVAGGGTAGVAAAYTCAKNGLKTLLIEKKIHLGGAMTSGLVIPVMNAGKSSINRDFFDELVAEMRRYNAQITFEGNKGWFNPEILKIVLDKMLSSVGVEILLNSQIILSEYIDKIGGNKFILNIASLSECIETLYLIDTTGDCEVGKILGAKFLEENETQPVTLRFIMSGIDMREFADFIRELDDNREVSPIVEINGTVHLSTAYTWDENALWALRPIFQKAVMAGDLTECDTNYFQVFTVAGCDGALAFNCPRILKTPDITDIKAVSDTLIEARASIYRLAAFCKKYFKGFEKAYISNIADDLGVRVSRRVEGKYIYTETDLKSGKRFDNPVLEANYPIDVHSDKKNASKLQKVGYYQLPIESLMVKGFENFFVAGRCLSADFKAQAALRVQQSCFSMGEGVGKYIANVVNRGSQA